MNYWWEPFFIFLLNRERDTLKLQGFVSFSNLNQSIHFLKFVDWLNICFLLHRSFLKIKYVISKTWQVFKNSAMNPEIISGFQKGIGYAIWCTNVEPSTTYKSITQEWIMDILFSNRFYIIPLFIFLWMKGFVIFMFIYKKSNKLVWSMIYVYIKKKRNLVALMN
jgi:hypothetical protein